MAARLLNVRLTPEDQRIVERLKARGVSISEIMRRALRTEDEQAAPTRVDPEALVAELQATHPTPAKAKRSAIDATDRHAVRKHVQARLRGRR